MDRSGRSFAGKNRAEPDGSTEAGQQTLPHHGCPRDSLGDDPDRGQPPQITHPGGSGLRAVQDVQPYELRDLDELQPGPFGALTLVSPVVDLPDEGVEVSIPDLFQFTYFQQVVQFGDI